MLRKIKRIENKESLLRLIIAVFGIEKECIIGENCAFFCTIGLLAVSLPPNPTPRCVSAVNRAEGRGTDRKDVRQYAEVAKCRLKEPEQTDIYGVYCALCFDS